MRDLFQRLQRVAPTGVSVPLTGESGTGKELSNKTRAAAVLGVSLKTLYSRLNEYRALD